MATLPIGAKIGGDASGFVSAMAAGTRSLAAFTGAAGLATGGLGALAGAAGLGMAVKMTVEWQSELVKLNTLVGIQTEQIKEWEGAMMDIAQETGKAPADLAKAMFAITSGGARGSEALEILTQSARASAVGLGNMTEIGRLAGAAVIAFGDSGLTATKAIDVMMATVRAGNLEAAELAESLGRVMGVTAALGASFEDIGGFVATYTRLGVDARIATTSLSGALNVFLKPSKEAREEMARLGIPIEHLRDVIRKDGLNAGLQEMMDGLGGNIDSIGKAIPNIRALAGILGTVGVQADSYAQIQEEINESLGMTNEGFEVWSETAEATFAQFGVALQRLGITLGEVVLPALTPVVEMMTELVDILRPVVGWLGLFKEAGEENAEVLLNMANEALKASDAYQEAFKSIGQWDFQVGLGLQSQTREQLNTTAENVKKTVDSIKARIAELEGGPLGRIMPQQMEEYERLRGQLDGFANLLVLMDRRNEELAASEKEAGEAIQRRTILTDAEIEAEEKRQTAIQKILDSLDEEIRLLEEGEKAVMLHQLALLDAEPHQLASAAASFEKAKALREEVAASEEAARAALTLARQQERERERRAKAMKKAAQRLAENKALAEYQAQLAVVTDAANSMTDAFGDFFEAMVDGTETTAQAFTAMVGSILQDMARLAMQEMFIKPLLSAIIGQFGPATPGEIPEGVGNIDMSTFNKMSKMRNPGNLLMGGAAGNQIIVQQTIEVSPRLIDGRDGARFIREQGGEIARVVGQAARDSVGFANQLA